MKKEIKEYGRTKGGKKETVRKHQRETGAGEKLKTALAIGAALVALSVAYSLFGGTASTSRNDMFMHDGGYNGQLAESLRAEQDAMHLAQENASLAQIKQDCLNAVISVHLCPHQIYGTNLPQGSAARSAARAEANRELAKMGVAK